MAWYRSSMKSGAEEGGLSGGWGRGRPGRPRMDRISFCSSFFSRPLRRRKLEWTSASACWLHRATQRRSRRSRSGAPGWRRGEEELVRSAELLPPPPPETHMSPRLSFSGGFEKISQIICTSLRPAPPPQSGRSRLRLLLSPVGPVCASSSELICSCRAAAETEIMRARA
ncbi:hypothetical protein EYF80_039004 [Liparis tanakae]|uniref:Uncharacterized protein n=1 Tax=Liparis tanakae TaxID=230148 RepID=A0A4Z2GDP4_9TELE|nr:hypothetical protein EYF80_039004 [Liparis tanakae]